VNHLYAQTTPAEPQVNLNQHNPADPFAVIRFGDGWDFTSHDPAYCRRVAQAWTTAAELLEAAHRPVPEPQPEADREAGQ
jgi:hypothetical protein